MFGAPVIRDCGGTARQLGKPLADGVLASRSSQQVRALARERTVLFSDVKGFTTISERLDAETVVALLARGFAGEWGAALRTGIGLAQAGEFGFVLLTLAGEVQLLPEDVMQNVLAAMLISMLIAPFLIQHTEAIVRRVSPEEWMNRAMQMHQIAVTSMSSKRHIIICGYGRSGQALAKFLNDEGIDFIALDLDSRRVREAAAAGERVVYGDAGKHEASYARQLQTVLRREPDVVMISDCADRETAHLAAKAACEGKKIYLGIQARDSFDALKKLVSLAGDFGTPK